MMFSCKQDMIVKYIKKQKQKPYKKEKWKNNNYGEKEKSRS